MKMLMIQLLVITLKIKKNENNNRKEENKKGKLYLVDCLRILTNFLVIFIHCSDMDHQKKEGILWRKKSFFY